MTGIAAGLTMRLDACTGRLVDEAFQGMVGIRDQRGGSGAGTVWHADGLVVTNSHVAGDGELEIRLPGGGVTRGKVIARESDLDLAAVMAEAENLHTIAPGRSSELRAGQWVMALGFPWGGPGAATAGMVAGVGDDASRGYRPRGEWVTVSLRLRPGYSGGPLLDAAGRLVGVNTMMTGPNAGMAVPVRQVKAFLMRALGLEGTGAEDESQSLRVN